MLLNMHHIIHVLFYMFPRALSQPKPKWSRRYDFQAGQPEIYQARFYFINMWIKTPRQRGRGTWTDNAQVKPNVSSELVALGRFLPGQLLFDM